MRYLAVLACLFIGTAVRAQEEAPPVRWPVPIPSAHDQTGFAPPGWAVEASREGDVDGDGIADLVMILHERSARNVLHKAQMTADGLDSNPRMLIVAKGQRDGSYRLLFANHTLIPRWTEWNLDDPLGDLDGFKVERGNFLVPLHLFANAGGWGAFERSFTFRVVGGRCLLIGYDEQYLQRNTGETTTTSINYLTNIRVVTVEPADDTPAKTHRTRLPHHRPLTIDAIGDGIAFEAK